MDIEFTDESGFVDPRDLARRRFQSGFPRSVPNLSSHENLIEPNTPTVSVEIYDTQIRNPNGIDFSTTRLECVSQEMEELSQAIYAERVITEDLRFNVSEIQDRINSSMIGSRDNFSGDKNTRPMNPRVENRSREQDIVRKGIERLEKQISQYTWLGIN